MPTLSQKLCSPLSNSYLQSSQKIPMKVSLPLFGRFREVELVLQTCAQMSLLYVPIGYDFPGQNTQ